jgi:hypothetical protein
LADSTISYFASYIKTNLNYEILVSDGSAPDRLARLYSSGFTLEQ